MWVWSSGAGLWVLGLAVGTGPAEPPAVQWHWSRLPGAETCLDGGSLGRRIKKRLGRDPFGHPAALVIEGVVDRRPDGWRVRLFARAADGTSLGSRVLEAEGEDCGVLTDAVVLAAVLTIDPEALTRPPKSPEPPPTEPPAPPPPPAPAPPPFAPSRLAAAAPRTGTAAAHTSVSVGTLPRPTPGMALAVVVPVGARFAAGAGFGLWVAQRSGPVDAGLAAGWGEGCWVPFDGRFSLHLCGRLYAGALRVAIDAAPERDPIDPGQFFWAAAAPALRGGWTPVDRLRIEIDVTTPISLTRQPFQVDGSEVYRESPVALSLGLSIGLAI